MNMSEHPVAESGHFWSDLITATKLMFTNEISLSSFLSMLENDDGDADPCDVVQVDQDEDSSLLI